MIPWVVHRLAGAALFGATSVVFTPRATFAASKDESNGFGPMAVFVLIIAAIYEMAIIAFLRRHPNRWLILVINTAFAGTGIVWLVCLVWAFCAIHFTRDPQGTNGGEMA